MVDPVETVEKQQLTDQHIEFVNEVLLNRDDLFDILQSDTNNTDIIKADIMDPHTPLRSNGQALPPTPTGCIKFRNKFRHFVKTNLLLVLTVVAIVLGFVLGFAIREAHPSKDALMWLGLPGEVFMRLLKMMILPLIISSVISGTASLDPKANGKISGLSLGYISGTNIISAVIGIALTLAIRPGVSHETSSYEHVERAVKLQTQDIFADLIRNVCPDNIIKATIQQAQTHYEKREIKVTYNTSEGLFNKTSYAVHKTMGHTNGTNILGIIVFCLIVGVATSASKERGKPFLAFFTAATEIVIRILQWLLWYSPIGITSLIASSIAGITDLEATFAQLGLFILTVVVGIAIHQIFIIPGIHLLLVGGNPYRFYGSMMRAWLTGFAAASTAVTIPDMIRGAEEQRVDRRISRFVIPFCVTLNADGSALYIASAAVFVGQLNGGVDVGQIVVIGVLTAVAAMALPSVPSSSIVTLVIILSTIDLPTHDIAMLFAVEWLLDRVRTTSNIVSHVFCAAFTHHFCKKDLKEEKDIENDSSEGSDSPPMLHKSCTVETTFTTV